MEDFVEFQQFKFIQINFLFKEITKGWISFYFKSFVAK